MRVGSAGAGRIIDFLFPIFAHSVTQSPRPVQLAPQILFLSIPLLASCQHPGSILNLLHPQRQQRNNMQQNVGLKLEIY